MNDTSWHNFLLFNFEKKNPFCIIFLGLITTILISSSNVVAHFSPPSFSSMITFCIVLLTVTAMEQRKFEIRYFKFEPEARLEFLLFELVIGD